ncbi:MAG: choice-of-anchor Q domain-containing protein, partial [Bacteroidota bacterium]
PTSCTSCSVQDRKESFWIASVVRVYGGFAGSERRREERDWNIHRTVLSGDIDRDNTLANNSYSVIFTLNVNEQTVLDGLYVVMGNADGNSPSFEERESSGGGWFNAAVAQFVVTPIVRNCTFSRNYAQAFGGAVYNLGNFMAENSPYYYNCTFERNKAVFDGGGMYNNGSFGGISAPSIVKCTFKDNIAGTTDLGSAGAIFNNGIEGESSPIIVNTQFLRNTSSLEGGAIYNQGKSGNSSPELVNCIFIENNADLGGVMYNLGAEGRALPKITNCSFYDNFARNGGAIFNNGADGGNANTYVANSIFWQNEAESGQTFFNIVAVPQIYHSLVDETNCAALNQTLDELSQVICGPTLLFNTDPKWVNPTSGDLRLQSGSPAINIGDNSAIGEMTQDAREQSRILLDRIDLGAYEYDGPLPTRMDELLATYDDGRIVLDWLTKNEYENERFEVQHSIDSINFTTIATIASQGDASEPQNYTYTDEQPVAGSFNFYRLHRIDRNNCSEYSNIQQIFVELLETNAQLAPNPTTDESILIINLEKTITVEVQVVTPHGQVLTQPLRAQLPRGRHLIPISVGQGRTGLFYVYVRLDSERLGYPLLILD